MLHTVLEMIEAGATHIGVATDHVIESFRNQLWPDYKTAEGVEPALLAQFHFLALTGDAADGYPGIAGIGAVTAARLLNRHGPIEDFPAAVLGDDRDRALLFKQLATLRTDTPLFLKADELRWRGPTASFPAWSERMGDARLLERSGKAYGS